MRSSSLSHVLVALALLGSAPAAAQGVADFYRGKQVSLIVSASTGGGYDTYGRTVARHLGEHIPGKPTVVVQNMPAAGGLGAANHTYNVAAKDGTVITLFQNTVPLEPFFENKQAQFDAAKFGWLGTPTSEVALYMFWHTSKIRTLKDAQTLGYVAGAAGAASTPAFYGRVFNQIFNMKARFITGYPGQNEILHAMEGGEVEAMASPFWSSLKTSRPTWHKEGKIRFLFQYGGEDHPELKSVPRALDLLTTDADKTLLAVASAPLALGRPFAVPPPGRSRRPAGGAAHRHAGNVQGSGVSRRLRQAAARMRRSPRRRRARHADRPRVWRVGGRAQAADRDVSGDEVGAIRQSARYPRRRP
jgi:tripartite-type tricarboxylate transporter receptor subunit TctC